MKLTDIIRIIIIGFIIYFIIDRSIECRPYIDKPVGEMPVKCLILYR